MGGTADGYRLALADSHPMEVESGVKIGNPKNGATDANEADLPAKGFDDLWIYP